MCQCCLHKKGAEMTHLRLGLTTSEAVLARVALGFDAGAVKEVS